MISSVPFIDDDKFPQSCFPDIRSIITNHSNYGILHTWIASHLPNAHTRYCGGSSL
jgi:hypothetical protein